MLRSVLALVAAVVGLAVIPTARAEFGDPIAGLTAVDTARFASGKVAFQRVETVATGLGPVFNDVSCVACHSRPRVGGGSPIIERRFGTTSGGSFDPLTQLGGSTLQTNGIGPTASCNYVGESLPPQATIIAGRRTTPLYGLGLVNAVPDATFVQLAATQLSTSPTTAGRTNTVFDVPSRQMRVGRFGWKDQVATLYHFSGEAYVNEMGITNPLFPAEMCPQGDCASLVCDPLADPDDDGGAVEEARDFMILLAPPPPRRLSARAITGEALFTSSGCASCHVPTLQTGANPSAPLDHVTFHPYSDFLLHGMGALGDGVTQGQAAGAEMRTAPLWGLRRQRRVFLHDGRAHRLEDAILAHDGQGRAARDAFAALSRREQRAVIAFLRTL